MTIRVPLRLRRQSPAAPASALYIPTRSPAELLAVCALLDLDPSDRVFAVAGGFLMQLERPVTTPVRAAIRLKEVTPGLYLPADAQLVPSLLADEAAGVVRDRGLVFLHDGRVLGYSRHAPVELSALLEARTRPRRSWRSLPEPEPLAERLDQILLEVPDPAPDEIYRTLRKEMNRRPPRPRSSQKDDAERKAGSGQPAGDESDEARQDDAAQPGNTESRQPGAGDPARPRFKSIRELAETVRAWARRAAQAESNGEQNQDTDPNEAQSPKGRKHGAQAAFLRLGGALGAAFEAVSGPWGQAMSAVREKIRWEWVDHSALITKLVREFREGDPAQAHRRAIPIARPGDPTVPVRARWLPWSGAIYNLADLLRRPGRGEAVPVRIARDEVVRELMEEYRKAAEAAVRTGDFRRAAYIYGILLQDDRMAASALQRAGLHHDAALLYASKLNDRAAAARAFDAAGEFDRALQLYQGLGQHEAAGDLLRRIGEEQAAIEEYLAAATLLAARPALHLEAGRLLLAKVRRPDLAIKQFQAGWDARPAGNATLCAIELARLHAGRGAIEPIRTLLDQADALFESPGCSFDGSFYDETIRIAGEPALQPFAEELRDRALQAMGGSLRRGLENRRSSGATVSKLLGRSKLWPAPVLSDADFAVEAARAMSRSQTDPGDREMPVDGLQIGRGKVTAACQASYSGELLLGFDNGLVCIFGPEREQVVEVPKNSDPVLALAVDPQGQTFAVLYSTHRGIVLTCFSKHPDGSYRSRPDIQIPSMKEGWLTPILPIGVERLVGVLGGEDLIVFDAASGMVRERRRIGNENTSWPAAAFLLSAGRGSRASGSPLAIFTHDGGHWVVYDLPGHLPRLTGCRWKPATAGQQCLRSVPLSLRHAPPVLELVGVDQGGAVHAAEFHWDEDSIQLLASRVATTEEGYVAAAHAGTNMVVAISKKGIDWLSFHGDRFRLSKKVDLCLPSAVACFASHSRDALVVCSRGLLIRVAAPRRTIVANLKYRP